MKPIKALATPVVIIALAALLGTHFTAAQPQGRAQAEPVKKSILDIAVAAEDRRVVINPENRLYSSIGKFIGAMTCTAAIVLNPRIVLTSSHCITNKDGTLKISNLLFEPGYQSGRSLGQFKATIAAVGSRQNFQSETVQEASQDWALLVLDRAPHGVRPLDLSSQSFEDLKSLGRHILMPAYSIDIAKAERISLDSSCAIQTEAWDALVHDCRASFGSSGAPLLIRHDQHYAIVGIHTGALYVGDQKRPVPRFIGNRAISSNSFAAKLIGLSKLLSMEDFDAIASGA